MSSWLSNRQRASVLSALAALAVGVIAGSIGNFASAHGPEEQATAAAQFAAGEPGDPTKPFRVVELAMTESSGALAFSTKAVEVKQGEQIKFVITNKGELEHEFILDSIEHNAKHKIAMEKDPEMEHDNPNGVRLQPSKSGEILWRFTKAGTFEFACLIPGHYEADMHGMVIVK